LTEFEGLLPGIPQDRLHLKPCIGGEEFFRGILKSLFNLLSVNHPALALDPIFDPVRAFILTGVGGSRAFGRWPVRPPLPLPQLGEFDHLIAVYSRGGVVDAFAQFFGAFHWTFRLPATTRLKNSATPIASIRYDKPTPLKIVSLR
jgi:hypothetical protein